MAGDLLARGFDYWGIDASSNMICLGRERFHEHPDAARCRLNIGDAECLEFPDASFDRLISMGMLEYLMNYEPAMHELHRVLRPGGTAVVSVPNRACAYHFVRGMADFARGLAGRSCEPVYVNRCIPRRLREELEAQGFRVLESRVCKFICYPPQYIVRLKKPD
jgi:ubiquinone/menaquinone biosynthesis C-methylase UbiE